jgi:hypothetical protein
LWQNCCDVGTGTTNRCRVRSKWSARARALHHSSCNFGTCGVAAIHNLARLAHQLLSRTKPVVWRRKRPTWEGRSLWLFNCRSVGRLFVRGEVMWSRGLLIQNLLVPKKAKPHDSDAASADAVAEDRPLLRCRLRGRQAATSSARSSMLSSLVRLARPADFSNTSRRRCGRSS